MLISTPELDTSRPRIDLDGNWRFCYDPDDIGEEHKWADAGLPNGESARVPGCAQQKRRRSAVYQEDGRNHDGLPEAADTVMLRYPCRATSWYTRMFSVPDQWRDGSTWLHIGGVSPAATVFINGHCIGTSAASRTPLRCDISQYLNKGRWNTIAIKVFTPDVRMDGGWNLLTSWSGIYRSVWLESVEPVHIDDVHVTPSLRPRRVQVEITLNPHKRPAGEIWSVTCRIKHRKTGRLVNHISQRISSRSRSVKLWLDMPDAALWTLDDPQLHEVTVQLKQDKTVTDTARVRFGLREISVKGRRVLLNGKPVYFRGGAMPMFFPETVCPPADKNLYRKRIKLAKSLGFNYTKSCLEVFTREFVEAADELGFLVCQEMPFGARGGGNPNLRKLRFNLPRVYEKYYTEQARNIVVNNRNHPSVVLYSMASELTEEWLKPKPLRFFSQRLPAATRRLDPAALVIDVTGSTNETKGKKAVPIDTPAGKRDTDLQCDWLSWQWDLHPLDGPIDGIQSIKKPILLHEYAWIASLPNPTQAAKYARLPVKPLHQKQTAQVARRNGQGPLLDQMLRASRMLKHTLMKEALEKARRDRRVSGFHYWLIQDLPYCPEGVFDEFWRLPKDLDADALRNVNDDTVVLLKNRNCRWFQTGRRTRAELLVSHYGTKPVRNAVVRWQLRDGRRIVCRGEHKTNAIKCGSTSSIGTASWHIDQSLSRPRQMTLQIEVRQGSQKVCANAWPVWCFPKQLPHTNHQPRVIRKLSRSSIRALEAGERQLLLCKPTRGGRPGHLTAGKGEPLYRPVPYNQGRYGNMGTLIADHPALGRLPHDGWCDVVFADLIEGVYPVSLEPFGSLKIEPIIRSIGHHLTFERKAYLFEVAVGRGRLIVCSLNLSRRGHPLVNHLKSACLNYLSSRKLKSSVKLTPDQLQHAAHLP